MNMGQECQNFNAVKNNSIIVVQHTKNVETFTRNNCMHMNYTLPFISPEGALSIEVWGHRSAGFSRARGNWEVEQQQLAKARSLADRWTELTRKIELWVEIHELNDNGEYAPVEVSIIITA